MKKNTLIILGLVGLGIYLYMRSKKQMLKSSSVSINPAAPVNDTGVKLVDETGVEIAQSLDTKGGSGENYNVRFAINGYKKKLGNIPNCI